MTKNRLSAIVDRLTIQILILRAAHVFLSLLGGMAGRTILVVNNIFGLSVLHLAGPVRITQQLACQRNHLAFAFDQRRERKRRRGSRLKEEKRREERRGSRLKN